MKQFRTGLLVAVFAGAFITAAQADSFVYVGNADSNDIHVLKLNKAALVTAAHGSTLPSVRVPFLLADLMER